MIIAIIIDQASPTIVLDLLPVHGNNEVQHSLHPKCLAISRKVRRDKRYKHTATPNWNGTPTTKKGRRGQLATRRKTLVNLDSAHNKQSHPDTNMHERLTNPPKDSGKQQQTSQQLVWIGFLITYKYPYRTEVDT